MLQLKLIRGRALLALALILLLSSQATLAELADGALLTGPPMHSSIVTYPNILISIDNSTQSSSEVAWVPKGDKTYLTTPSGADVVDKHRYTLYYKKDSSGVPQKEYFDDRVLVPFERRGTTVVSKPSLSFGRTGTSTAATHTNITIARARSHYGNPMYYNPAMTYTPWNYLSHNTYKYGVTATTPFPATAAPLDISISDTATVNLIQDYSYDTSTWTGIAQSIPSNPNNWKAHVKDGTSGDPFQGSFAAPDYAADTFRLATYYVYKMQPSGTSFLQSSPLSTQPMQNTTFASFAGDLSRYKKIIIDAATPNYEWYPSRTDCVTVSAVCTYAEELENFKNWFIYYRTKLNAQKAVMSWALSRLGSEYRIGLRHSNYKFDSAYTENTVPVMKFDAVGRAAIMKALFSARTWGSFNELTKNLMGMGQYFKNAGEDNPWLDDSGSQSTSCRPSAAIMMTDGSSVASNLTELPGYDSKYTLGASVASDLTPLNLPERYQGTVSRQYLIDTNSAPNRAQFSGVDSLSSIAHANYWYDLMPNIDNTPFRGNNMPRAGFLSDGQLSLVPHWGDPAAHQRLRLHVLSFGMPGANNPAYIKTESVATRVWNTNAIPAPTWGSFAYDRNQQELKNIDDLQQAAFNGHGAFIEWQSSDRQFKLDPRMQLFSQMASMLPRMTGSFGGSSGNHGAVGGVDGQFGYGFTTGVDETLFGYGFDSYESESNVYKYSETAVMEDIVSGGVPQTALYKANFESGYGGGGLVAQNGSGLFLYEPRTPAGPPVVQPPWAGFNAEKGLMLAATAVPNVVNGRNIYAPTMTSLTGALGPTIAFIPPYAESPVGTNVLPSTVVAPGAAINPFMMSAFFNNDSNLVWWLRGSEVHENRYILRQDQMHRYPFRKRAWAQDLTTMATAGRKLGAIINSHPVAVRMQDFGYGADFTTGASYRAFLKFKAAARPRVAVGSNDGMFRVFNGYAGPFETTNTTGLVLSGTPSTPEDFAYIPAGVMGNLKQQAHPHYMFHMKGIGVSDPDIGFRYTVDGPASTGDVQFTTGGAWKSVVTGSLGNGGRGLFAIDVTAQEPATSASTTPMTAANLLWDKTVAGQWTPSDWADVGAIRNRTGIFKLTTGEFAVITGNGANSDNGQSVLFVLNAETGAVIKKITAGRRGGGLTGVSFLFNPKREVVAVYGGDLQGSLWKFDLSAATAAAWDVGNGGNPLLEAASVRNVVQPITTRPALYEHPDGLGTLVMVGTGANFRYKDPGLLAQHTVYGVLDRSTATTSAPPMTASRSSLVEQVLSDLPGVLISGVGFGGGGNATRTLTENNVDYAVDNGWYVDLPFRSAITNTYEAVIGDPKMVGERLLVPSVVPMPVHGGLAFDTCDPLSALLGAVTSINPLTGGLLPWTVYDTNDDRVVNSADNRLATGYVSANPALTQGILPAITRTGNGNSLVRENAVTSANSSKPVKSWRELQPR